MENKIIAFELVRGDNLFALVATYCTGESNFAVKRVPGQTALLFYDFIVTHWRHT